MGKYLEITNSKIIKIKERKIVYYAFIKPYTEYGILAWGGSPKTHLNKISINLKRGSKGNDV